MTHIPAHHGGGSLCDPKVEPTPGLLPFPAPPPVDAGDDLCDECRRLHGVYSQAHDRATHRYNLPPRRKGD